MRLIGITGSIGSGKSTVLRWLADHGAKVWDADEAVHRLYRPGQEGWKAIQALWGEEILDADGRVNRKRIAARVFGQPEERRRLEAAIHPLVLQDLLRTAGDLQSTGALWCAAPLLYEGGWEKEFTTIVCVWSPPELTRERLKSRGLTDAEISARFAAQENPDEKLRRADHGVINSGNLELLHEQCRRLYQLLLHINP